jgi:hypothetical protein
MSDNVDIQIVEDEAGTKPADQFVILANEELDKAVKWLQDEFNTSAREMEARNNKVIKWRRTMEAVAEDAPKSTPFKNASNVTIPLTQTLGQDMYSILKGMFDARSPLWTIRSLRKDTDLVKRHKTVQKYLTLLASSPNDLNMEEVLKDLVMETAIAGGCFPKVIWDTNSWRVMGSDGGGEKEVVKHDGPMVVVVPVERCNYRRGVPSIDRLPWIGLTTPMTEIELKELASKGIFDATAVSSMLSEKRTSPNEVEAQQQKAEWFDEVETTGLYDITEFWFYYDVDGTGVPVDLFFTIHVPTGTVLKQQYNSLGARFVVNAKYMHRSFGLTGRGIGQMTESMNSEATSIHNLTNDNMKIANTRMFAVKRGMNKKEEIYPGKLWELDSADDLRSIQMGDVYPSSSARESLSWSIAQRAIGLSDNQMGFADQTMGSRDTARGQAMRLANGDSIKQNVVDGLMTTVSKIGMLVWMQCIANKERVMAREAEAQRLSPEELADLQTELSVPLGEVPTRMAFDVQTTENEKTFEVQRQNMMMLAQLYAQFAQQTVPLAMQLFGPQGVQMQQQAPELWKYMLKVLEGSGKLVENIFEFFNVTNTQDYVPSMETVSKISAMLGQVGASFAGIGQGTGMIASPQGMPSGLPPQAGQGMGQSSPQNAPQGIVGAAQGNPQGVAQSNGGGM